MTPDVSRPVPFLQAARAVFDLALESMVWSRRTLVMGLLMALPVVFGLLYRVALAAKLPPKITPFSLFGDVMVAYYLSTVLPLAALFYATALVADEVEGKTISYLLTRPVARPAILAGKFAAYLATTLSLALPATLVTFFLLVTARGRGDLAPAVPDLFRDLAVVALALLAYGALFSLLGVMLRRPTLTGLMFIFVWERLLSHLPGYLPRFTLISYLRSLVSHRPPETGIQGVFLQLAPPGLSLAVLLLASLAFLAAAVWIFSSREYVVEQ